MFARTSLLILIGLAVSIICAFISLFSTISPSPLFSTHALPS